MSNNENIFLENLIKNLKNMKKIEKFNDKRLPYIENTVKKNELPQLNHEKQKVTNENKENHTYFENLINGKSIRFLNFRELSSKNQNKPKKTTDYYYKITSNESFLIESTLIDNGFSSNKSNLDKNTTLFWKGGPLRPSFLYNNLYFYQKINHFPNSQQITRKDLLYNNILRLSSMSSSTLSR